MITNRFIVFLDGENETSKEVLFQKIIEEYNPDNPSIFSSIIKSDKPVFARKETNNGYFDVFLIYSEKIKREPIKKFYVNANFAIMIFSSETNNIKCIERIKEDYIENTRILLLLVGSHINPDILELLKDEKFANIAHSIVSDVEKINTTKLFDSFL